MTTTEVADFDHQSGTQSWVKLDQIQNIGGSQQRNNVTQMDRFKRLLLLRH